MRVSNLNLEAHLRELDDMSTKTAFARRDALVQIMNVVTLSIAGMPAQALVSLIQFFDAIVSSPNASLENH